MTTAIDRIIDRPATGTDRPVVTSPIPAGELARSARAAGVVALLAVILCLVGVVFNQVLPSADIYAAMESSTDAELATRLAEVAEDRTPIVIGFSAWMIAFQLTALASILLIRLGRPGPLGDAVRHLTAGTIGTMIVFLSMFIAYVVEIAPAHVAGEDVIQLAQAVGFMATTADWVITAVVLGLAPATAVFVGRGIWAPRWLLGLAAITAAYSVVELVAIAADVRVLALPQVPLGLALTGAAGVCALRHPRTAA